MNLFISKKTQAEYPEGEENAVVEYPTEGKCWACGSENIEIRRFRTKGLLPAFLAEEYCHECGFKRIL